MLCHGLLSGTLHTQPSGLQQLELKAKVSNVERHLRQKLSFWKNMSLIQWMTVWKIPLINRSGILWLFLKMLLNVIVLAICQFEIKKYNFFFILLALHWLPKRNFSTQWSTCLLLLFALLQIHENILWHPTCCRGDWDSDSSNKTKKTNNPPNTENISTLVSAYSYRHNPS